MPIIPILILLPIISFNLFTSQNKSLLLKKKPCKLFFFWLVILIQVFLNWASQNSFFKQVQCAFSSFKPLESSLDLIDSQSWLHLKKLFDDCQNIDLPLQQRLLALIDLLVTLMPYSIHLSDPQTFHLPSHSLTNSPTLFQYRLLSESSFSKVLTTSFPSIFSIFSYPDIEELIIWEQLNKGSALASLNSYPSLHKLTSLRSDPHFLSHINSTCEPLHSLLSLTLPPLSPTDSLHQANKNLLPSIDSYEKQYTSFKKEELCRKKVRHQLQLLSHFF